MTKSAPQDLAALKDYKLPIDHEHEGRLYKAGETLPLYPDQIKLIESVAKVKAQVKT